MHTRIFTSFLLVAFLLTAASALALEPADPDLIPEGRAVLNYLESIYGKKTLAGLNGIGNVAGVKKSSGKEPALVGFDLSGWNSPPWGKTYVPVVERSVEAAKAWWARGGLVAMQCHWIHPANPDGSAWREVHGRKTASPPFAFEEAMTPGTKLNEAMMRDLKGHADFLQKLADARVPVLWRPFHEIEGGWFWWTDAEQPEHSAALYRYMFNYFVKERKLHNLIWVYNAALRCGKGKDGLTAVEMRRRYYPGDAYVDIASIDVYPNEYLGIGKPQDDPYAASFAAMKQVAPGKMIALAECEAIPAPDKVAQEGPHWLYAMPWWGVGKKNPEEWVKTSYAHADMITLEQLPKWNRQQRVAKAGGVTP